MHSLSLHIRNDLLCNWRLFGFDVQKPQENEDLEMYNDRLKPFSCLRASVKAIRLDQAPIFQQPLMICLPQASTRAPIEGGYRLLWFSVLTVAVPSTVVSPLWFSVQSSNSM